MIFHEGELKLNAKILIGLSRNNLKLIAALQIGFKDWNCYN